MLIPLSLPSHPKHLTFQFQPPTAQPLTCTQCVAEMVAAPPMNDQSHKGATSRSSWRSRRNDQVRNAVGRSDRADADDSDLYSVALKNTGAAELPERHSNAQAVSEARSGHRLKLVGYTPPGGEPHTCAAIWRNGDYVRLSSPLLRTSNGLRDPNAYVRQFPDSFASLDTFEETMTWLDAACYAATDTRQVEVACQEHPEWQLACVRYDGGDAALHALGNLIQAAEKGALPPKPLMRDCLLELVRQVLKNEPRLADSRVDVALDKTADVAILELGVDHLVHVALLPDVASGDAHRQAMLANDRMLLGSNGWAQCLLVVPSLKSREPMFVPPRVMLVAMDAAQIGSSLARMAQR